MINKQDINKMELLCKKSQTTDQGSIDITTLSDVIADILWNKILGFIDSTIDCKLEVIPKQVISRKDIESVLNLNGVFNIANGINVSAGSSIENGNTPVGVLYYDPIKDKYKAKLKNGFKSIKFEE